MGFPVWTSPCVPKSKDRQSKMSAEQAMKLGVRGLVQGLPSWMVSPRIRGQGGRLPWLQTRLCSSMCSQPLLAAPPGAWVERPRCCVVKVQS